MRHPFEEFQMSWSICFYYSRKIIQEQFFCEVQKTISSSITSEIASLLILPWNGQQHKYTIIMQIWGFILKKNSMRKIKNFYKSSYLKTYLYIVLSITKRSLLTWSPEIDFLHQLKKFGIPHLQPFMLHH